MHQQVEQHMPEYTNNGFAFEGDFGMWFDTSAPTPAAAPVFEEMQQPMHAHLNQEDMLLINSFHGMEDEEFFFSNNESQVVHGIQQQQQQQQTIVHYNEQYQAPGSGDFGVPASPHSDFTTDMSSPRSSSLATDHYTEGYVNHGAFEAQAEWVDTCTELKQKHSSNFYDLIFESDNDNTDADEDDEDYKPSSSTSSSKKTSQSTKRKKGQVKSRRATKSRRVRASSASDGNPVPRILTSQYRGVCWYKRTQRWVAQIKIRGRRKHVGYYKNEMEAKLAYDRAVAKLVANPNIDLSELTNP